VVAAPDDPSTADAGRVMLRRWGPPGLLVAAIAWAVAAMGATSARDLLLVLLLVVAARVGMPRGGITPVRLLVPLAALGIWLVGAGPLRSGVELSSVRAPVLLLIVVLAASTVAGLDREQRDWTLRGVIVVASTQAVLAVIEAGVQLAAAGWATAPRADALLGNPNALGVLLVATAVLTARELAARHSRPLLAVLVVHGVALLATGSRLALVLGMVVLVWTLARRGQWREAVGCALWMLAAGGLVLSRTLGAPPERMLLWGQALKQIARHPWAGRGTTPVLFDIGPTEALPTTHAHNEVLQLAVEYGGIGLALVALTLWAAVTSAPRPARYDAWVVVAGASLLASGLTDFGLRITAIALTAAVVGSVALLAPGRGLSHDAADVADAADAQAMAGPRLTTSTWKRPTPFPRPRRSTSG